MVFNSSVQSMPAQIFLQEIVFRISLELTEHCKSTITEKIKIIKKKWKRCGHSTKEDAEMANKHRKDDHHYS